jgi:hypothetical protein
VAGFVDGEGSFNVPIRRERDRTMPLRAGLSFNVSQIGRGHPEMLQEGNHLEQTLLYAGNTEYPAVLIRVTPSS